MLTIKLDGEELYNEETGEFSKTKPITVRLEHSLISISKWESIWEKPFISQNQGDKSAQELISYISCMVIGDIPDYALQILCSTYVSDIQTYIQAPSTATIIKRESNISGRSTQFITSELIYYWMVAFNIPFETQRWHLNRLLTLIDICNVKQSKPKTPSKSELMKKRRAMNNQRRQSLNTRG